MIRFLITMETTRKVSVASHSYEEFWPQKTEVGPDLWQRRTGRRVWWSKVEIREKQTYEMSDQLSTSVTNSSFSIESHNSCLFGCKLWCVYSSLDPKQVRVSWILYLQPHLTSGQSCPFAIAGLRSCHFGLAKDLTFEKQELSHARALMVRLDPNQLDLHQMLGYLKVILEPVPEDELLAQSFSSWSFDVFCMCCFALQKQLVIKTAHSRQWLALISIGHVKCFSQMFWECDLVPLVPI